MGERKPKVCVYCGKSKDLTVDHIPPKALFKKPRPELITVPACRKCNGSASKDDEYFRLMLGLNDAGRGHPDVDANAPTILRSLQRPEAAGLRKAYLSALIPVEQRTASGLYVGRSLAYNVDLTRINRVLNRVVRGLLWCETGEVLSDEFAVDTTSEDTSRQFSPGEIQDIMDDTIIPLSKAPAKVVGDNVFSYRYLMSDPRPISVWALVFYGKIPFLGVILERKELKRLKA